MKQGIHLIIIMLLFGPLVASIPLEKAITNGIKINMGHQSKLLDEKINKLLLKNTQMSKFFSLQLAGSYIYRSEQMEIILPDMNPAPGITIPGERIQAGSQHNYDIKLVLLQPLFTGRILTNAVKQEEIQGAINQHATFLKKNDIAAAIKTSYFTYQSLINRQDSLLALIKQLDLHYQKLQDFYAEDLVKKSDLLETEGKIQELQLTLEDLNDLIAKEKINFTDLCGLRIEDISPDFIEASQNLQGSIQLFLSSHPILKTLEENLKILQLREKAIQGKYLPQISGFAELHYGKPGIDYFKNEWSLYFQGGISVNYALFDWNKKNREIKIIRHTLDKVKNQKEEFIQQNRKYLKQLYNLKSITLNKINILKNLSRINREDNSLKEKLFQEQQISNIDYLASLTKNQQIASQTNEMKARLQVINVTINKIIGKYQEVK